MTVGLILLVGVYFFPLWRITLDAPQFPGGLRMDIWINQISGDSESGDIIQNINILNHYVGMKYIEPDSIPELKYFPYIIAGMLVLGVGAILFQRRWAFLTWGIVMSCLGVLGIYDFYLWMYDYGHNLDPSAPIKLPGMTYMPPLFGEKDLLNFYVTSYPHYGTILLVLSIMLAFLAAWKWKSPHTENTVRYAR